MTGAELRALRKRLGLTQTALATALGMSVSQVGDYERGYRTRSIYEAGRFATVRVQVTIPPVVDLAMDTLASWSEIAADPLP